MKYRIARKARGDLDAIWHYSNAAWGPDRADGYIDAMIGRPL